jgi:2-polyprenyl-3-methyl-5-hydroxy-6-metoxy-1,4-benzoquinol methylase
VALIDRDRAFDRFAAREPYFSVLTDPRFLRDRLTPEAEREFFASGDKVVAWMLGVIDAGLVPQFAPMSTLEYGCGIGRLAMPLARRPGSVTAVDRSPAMLALAKQEANRRGLGHIVFQTPAEVFASKRTFDLVVCYHVLQRLRRPAATALLRRLLALVGPNGVGVFQWP